MGIRATQIETTKMRVLITGCFDILHPGHLFFLEQAAALGEVYVIVARDATIRKYKKKNPTIPEDQRLEMIQALKNVKFATLGNENNNYIRKALNLHPDIILLGPNQRISVSKLKEELEKYGAPKIEVRRIKELSEKYELNSSSKIKEKIIHDSK